MFTIVYPPGSGTGWDGNSNDFSSLPSAASSTNKIYLVKTSTGTWPFRNPAGLYLSNGSSWTLLAEMPEGFFDDSQAIWYDQADTTKRLQFQLSGISTGTTRTATWPNKSGTVAMTSDVIIPSGVSGDIQLNSGSSTLDSDSGNFNFNKNTHQLLLKSTLSSEIILNGTFTGGSSNWTLATGWAYSSNTILHNSNGTGTLSQTSSTVTIGRVHVLTYTISALTVGSVTPTAFGATLTQRSANGTYTEYFIPSVTSGISFTPTNTARFTIDDVSVKSLSGGDIFSGGNISTTGNLSATGLNLYNSNSSSTPTSSPQMTITGSGTYSNILFKGGSNSVAAFQSSSTGELRYFSAGGTHSFNIGSLASSTNVGIFYSGGVYVTGTGNFSNSVLAGTASTSGPATLTTFGSLSARVQLITNNTTLTRDYTTILADATDSSSCTGTNATVCSSITNSTDCTTAGCTWSSINCSDYNGDQGTCEATSGCTWETADCSVFNGDQSNCESASGCTWDSMSSTCSGSYATGVCSGSGGSCSGTPFSCYLLPDSSACTAATGCSWTTSLALILPSEGVSDIDGRIYAIKNVSSSNQDVIIYPNTGQLVEGTSSLTLSNTNDVAWLTFYTRIFNCSTITNQMDCDSMTGCSWSESNCDVFTDEASCIANAGCSWDGSLCSGSYGGACSGSPIVSKNWYRLGDI